MIPIGQGVCRGSRFAALLAGAALLCPTACNKPKAEEPTWHASDMPHPNPKPFKPPPEALDPNIIGVKTLFFINPWINLDDDRDADGFRFTLYLESGTTRNKARFGDGTIVVSVFHFVPGPDGKRKRELLFRQEYTPEQAVPYRVRDATAIGWGYGMRVSWGDRDVYGKEIEVVTSFVRRDGKVYSSSPSALRVEPRHE